MFPHMHTASPEIAHPRRRKVSSLAVAVTMLVALVSGAASAGMPEANASADDNHLIYLPSDAPGVDHAAIIRAFEERGFNVSTYAYAGEDRVTYAKRVAGEIRGLLRRGVDPGNISVVGAGSGSPIALLTSAALGNRHVNYVVLGQCDAQLKQQYTFHLAGNVLGVRDAEDRSSHSCRPMFERSPRLRERFDLVLKTGYGAALFDRPHEAWLQPMVDWTSGGQVDVGDIKVTQVDRSDVERVKSVGAN